MIRGGVTWSIFETFWVKFSCKSSLNTTYIVSFGAVVVVRRSSPVPGVKGVTFAADGEEFHWIVTEPQNLKNTKNVFLKMGHSRPLVSLFSSFQSS